MNTLPVRLSPGDDLRRALEAQAPALGGSAMVVAGIGSLTDARLRFAGAESLVTLPGLFEIISLSGTLSRDGAHLHMSVAGADGRVFGGHVPYGNTVRTTAEVLLVALHEWQLTRAPDAATGFLELRIEPRSPSGRGG